MVAFRKGAFGLAAAAGLLLCAPVSAQDESAAPGASPQTAGLPIVSARSAASVQKALDAGGYQSELFTDEETGEVIVNFTMENWNASVVFRDCDDAVAGFCDTLVLSAAFDRDTPISDAQVRAANVNHRYVSVWSDEEGDPFIQWAILTLGKGIDPEIFLSAVQRYSSVVDAFGAVAFEGDDEEEITAGTSGTSGTLLVANKRGNTLTKIDLATGETLLTLPSCTNPHELAVSPDGKHVALGCYGGTTVDIFDAASLEKVESIDLGENARPHGIVWHKDGDIFATAEGRRSVFWIGNPLGDPQLMEHATAKDGSHMIAVAPDTRAAWTTDLSSKTVTRIDLRGKADPLSVQVGEEPEGIALSPDGKSLWVSARGSDQAFELDPVTMEVRRTVATGRFPLRLAIRPQGDVAITSDLSDGSLSVIDLETAKVTRTIAVSSPKEAQERFQVTILWSADGSEIFVAETASNTVAQVDYGSGRVLRRLTAGDGGDGLAILP